MRKTGGFVTESALFELLRYATKYHEPVSTWFWSMTCCFLPHFHCLVLSSSLPCPSSCHSVSSLPCPLFMSLCLLSSSWATCGRPDWSQRPRCSRECSESPSINTNMKHYLQPSSSLSSRLIVQVKIIFPSALDYSFIYLCMYSSNCLWSVYDN